MNEGINPAFDLIGLTQLRNDSQFAGIDGSGFSVAVIDTGINYNHSLLAQNYVTGYDFYDNDSDPIDDQGHGTHVAGTVGTADETIGVAPDVGIIGLDVFPGRGGARNEDISDALQWVLNNHDEYNIVSVNMSLGGGFYTSEVETIGDPQIELIDRLEEEGIVVVTAAGNSYQYKDRDRTIPNEEENIAAPSIFSTLAVGAVWQDDDDPGWYVREQVAGADRITSFSQRLDAENFIFAPGAAINSTSIDGGFELMPGTSMASPHVAGAVALLQEASLEFGGRLLAPDEVVEILRSTADTIVDGDDEEDVVANTGLSFLRMNIYNAIVEIKRRSDGIAPPPPDDDENPEEPIGSDPNGTIAGAYIGPTLDGEPVNPVWGTIGVDGNETFVGDKDVDIISFEVKSPGLVTLELGTLEVEPEDFDTYLRLFDANGTELAANDDIDPGIEQFSRLEVNLEPGTYYAGVSGFDNGSYDPNVAGSGVSAATGNYSLQFDLSNSDPNGLISGATEVLLGNDLEPLIFPGYIGADYGEPVGTSDVDLFRIIVPDDGVLFVDIDTPYAEGEYVDSFLRLFGEDGEELFFADTGEPSQSDDDVSFNLENEDTEFLVEEEIVLEDLNQTTLIDGRYNDDGNYLKGNYGHRTDSFLGVNVSRGDVYYIGVSDYFNSDYDATNLNNRPETGEGGLYELITTFVNRDLNGTITQITSETDLPLLNSQQNLGEDEGIEVGNRDVDFWKFNSASEGILEIDVDSDGVDSVALLFDGEGRLLAENDDVDGRDPLLQYQIEAETDYWVAVTGYGNQNFDPFALASGLGGDTGAYTINASLLNLDRFSSLSDNSVDSELVRDLSLDRAIAGDVGEDNGFSIGAEDIDLYRFTPERDSAIEIRVAAGREFSADTFLRLFDSEGNEIAANDNETDLIRGSFLQQEVTANTEYIIGVNGSSDNARDYNPLTGEGAAAGSMGDYTLTVTESGSQSSEGLGSTVYRFFNPAAGVHFYTADENERNYVRDNLNNYAFEGESYATVDPVTGNSPEAVYRFFNSTTGVHLYTTDENERDYIVDNLNNFTYENVKFYAYETEEAETVPVYRFYEPTIGVHFYTPNESEKTFVEDNLANYTYEGIAYHAFPASEI